MSVNHGHLLNIFNELNRHLSSPVTLSVIGSCNPIMRGQDSRMIEGIDIWMGGSTFEANDLKSACEAVGLNFNAEHDNHTCNSLNIINSDDPAAALLSNDGQVRLCGFDHLTIVSPPIECVIAHLIQTDGQENMDSAAFLIELFDVQEEDIRKIIERIPQPKQGEIMDRLAIAEYPFTVDDAPKPN